MARRKNKRSLIYIVSIGAHVLIGVAIAMIPKEKLREVVGIALAENVKPEKKAEPPPPRKEEAPKARAPRAAPGPRAAAPAAAEAAPQNAQNAFTDLGISLDSSAVGGIAVPVAAKAPLPVAPPPVQVSKPKVLAARLTNDECTEQIIKARPERVVQPEYTQAARSAGAEGRVRLELQIDEQGEVKNVRVIQGIGHGLDEAALAAAKRTRFRPATRCGKPVMAPFILSMRFVLGA